MITENEKILLNELRQNSRISLSDISKKTNIPISTLFETLKRLQDNVVVKNVSLLNFFKLGYGIKVNFLISSKNKYLIKDFLMSSNSVNNLSLSLNGFDLYVECIFKDFSELTDVKEKILSFGCDTFNEIFILEDIKKESFTL